MSIARAIQHLDRYAQKDLRALTARVLEPALRALPEAFENDSEDALALREAVGVARVARRELPLELVVVEARVRLRGNQPVSWDVGAELQKSIARSHRRRFG